jgi:Flp pilus assembly pilin Flp
VSQLLADERGQDLNEYAVVIALVAIVVIGAVILLGNSFSLLLGEIASEVGP